MKKYVFDNIVGEEITLNVHDSITEKGISNYPKSGNRIIYIDEFKDFFEELFSGFGEKKLTVLDIGSNGGIFSIYCSPVCEKIYAIVSFYFIPDCTGQSTIHQRIKAKDADPIRLIVNSYTILSFIKQHKIDYVDICKVDIEGEEVNIFSDEDIESLSPYVDKFWIEVHYTSNINGKWIQQNYQEITDRFRKKGFSIIKDATNYGFIARKKK